MSTSQLLTYLEQCKDLVYPELQRIVPEGPFREVLYDRMLDYPRRSAKALRPALCIAACRAMGGALQTALPTAAVLELYHNAFLVHDDVEDGSELRRDLPTLHTTFGIPIAVNVGDAMLALALAPLLDNTRTIGLAKALRVLHIVAEMARVTAEGQALELEWIRTARFDLSDDHYVDMVARKTSHYSFVAPLLLGSALAGSRLVADEALRAFGRDLGVAFQIQDDVLNLTEDTGKELDGDLYEGKHTLILLHVVRSATPQEKSVVAAILAKPRRAEAPGRSPGRLVRETISHLGPKLSPESAELLLRACDATDRALTGLQKTDEDVAIVKGLAMKYGSIPYAREAAARWAESAAARFDDVQPFLGPGPDADFIRHLVGYVVERSR